MEGRACKYSAQEDAAGAQILMSLQRFSDVIVRRKVLIIIRVIICPGFEAIICNYFDLPFFVVRKSHTHDADDSVLVAKRKVEAVVVFLAAAAVIADLQEMTGRKMCG